MRKYLPFAFLVLGSIAVHAQADNRDCSGGGIPYWILNHQALKDGPADLFKRCVNTANASMPSPGPITVVLPGQNLQAVYNAVACGATIKLTHGTTWPGPYDFAHKGCDDLHWVTFLSDGKLPGPGTRATPSVASQMAKIVPTGNAFSFMGDHIRMIGIEWAEPLDGHIHYGFITMNGADHISIERSWFHGNPHQEMNHGVVISTGISIAITDSYFSNFHCIAVIGACVDAQAISGGVGAGVGNSGPVKIVNNFIEASGEGILFGGGGADGVGPNDVEIRRNHFFKPMSWNPGDPSYDGGTAGPDGVKHPYITKNLFELKNCNRCFLEGNVLENNWGGFSQAGYAVLFTPKSQSNLCPLCAVTDVVFRYNYVATASGFAVIASGPSDAGGWSAGNHRLSIHDIVIDNLQYATCFGCGTMLSEVASPYGPVSPPPPSEVLSDVLVSHITLIAPNSLVGVGGRPTVAGLFNVGSVPAVNPTGTPQASNISFVNSIASAPLEGMFGTGGGGNNCFNYAKPQHPVAEWPACFVGSSSLTNNLMVGYPRSATDWPPGNTVIASFDGVFVNYNSGVGGDYHLVTGSPYAGLGADIDAVNQAIQGVR